MIYVAPLKGELIDSHQPPQTPKHNHVLGFVAGWRARICYVPLLGLGKYEIVCPYPIAPVYCNVIVVEGGAQTAVWGTGRRAGEANVTENHPNARPTQRRGRDAGGRSYCPLRPQEGAGGP